MGQVDLVYHLIKHYLSYFHILVKMLQEKSIVCSQCTSNKIPTEIYVACLVAESFKVLSSILRLNFVNFPFY